MFIFFVLFGRNAARTNKLKGIKEKKKVRGEGSALSPIPPQLLLLRP